MDPMGKDPQEPCGYYKIYKCLIGIWCDESLRDREPSPFPPVPPFDAATRKRTSIVVRVWMDFPLWRSIGWKNNMFFYDVLLDLENPVKMNMDI